MSFRKLLGKKRFTTGLTLLIALALMLSACGGGNTPANTGGTKTNNQKEETGTETKTPEKSSKLRVMFYDRGNAPDGMKLDDSVLIKWTKEEVAKIGIDLEFVTVPRAQAEEKLNVWLASGQAPDIIFTYNQDTLFKYAQQGGLWDLDDLIKEHGTQLLAHNKDAFDAVGMYKEKIYTVPMLRGNPLTGAGFKIRQDWLDKLDLKAPTTTDELYEVLKAFKEKDPGGVGKDNVVPWAFPAIGKAFLYNIALSFGIDSEGPNNGLDMAGGNIIDGQFVSNIATPAGKEMLLFLNKLYKEGLIPREFATDVNKQQYTQSIANGTAGFVDANEGAYSLTNDQTKKAVPEAKWTIVEPLVRPDGKQVAGKAPAYGMYIMIPKASKQEQAEAAIKYLNWMANDEIIYQLQNGLKDTHWKEENGEKIAIDLEANNKEFGWFAGSSDLSIVQQGQPPMPRESYFKRAERNEMSDPDYYADDIINTFAIFEKYGVTEPLLSMERPFSQKNKETILKFLNESLSKIIIAADPEKEYNALIAGWEKLGGKEYDKEVTEALKQGGRL
ncbi:extracellular solute-binding protein [Paenibacillaceae bacterium]|nr:extracellular solute-binding protein [Paenibacillaceae bacterium]